MNAVEQVAEEIAAAIGAEWVIPSMAKGFCMMVEREGVRIAVVVTEQTVDGPIMVAP